MSDTSMKDAARGGRSAAMVLQLEVSARRVKLSEAPVGAKALRYLTSCLDAYGFRIEPILHDG